MWLSNSPNKKLFCFVFDLETTQQKNISIASIYGEIIYKVNA